MPGVNGVEALKTIRTVAPHLTVIMMTAFTSDELVEEARRASAVESSSRRSTARASI